MRFTKRSIELLTRFLSGELAAWLIFAMMIVILIEVVTRYTGVKPLIIADEIGSYVVVAVTFLGLAYTWKERAHVRVEFLISRLSEKIRNWLRVVSLVGCLVFTILLTKAGWVLLSYSLQINSKSATPLHIPQFIPQIPLIIGSAVLVLQLTVELVKAVKLVAPRVKVWVRS